MAAIAFAVSSFAQNNNATLNQNGSSNNSSTSQSGQSQQANIYENGAGNKSTTTQTGAFQQNVDVIQNGDNNEARSHQDNAAGTGNFVKITQNTSTTGFNLATVDQSGKNMNATILQQGNATNSLASVLQRGPQSGGQSGSAGDGQHAFITQTNGDNNKGYITQESNWGMGQFNTATIDQSGGSNNLATVNQLTSVGYNEVGTIIQVGSSNIGLVQQENFYASGETATLTQIGSNNHGYLRQDIQSATYVVNNMITAYQQGDNNQIDIRQGNGSNNTATLTQLGDFNTIAGLSGGLSSALQSGSSNTLTVLQTGDHQTAKISQVGTGNTGGITQTN